MSVSRVKQNHVGAFEGVLYFLRPPLAGSDLAVVPFFDDSLAPELGEVSLELLAKLLGRQFVLKKLQCAI